MSDRTTLKQLQNKVDQLNGLRGFKSKTMEWNKEKGEAILSTEQIYGVIDDILSKNINSEHTTQDKTQIPPTFKTILKDFPPFSLN